MTKCIFEMLLLVQTYIPNMCISIFFNELVSISNIWIRYFIYKENTLLIKSQLHQLNLEQNLTNVSSFTYHMLMTWPIQPPPPSPPMHNLVLLLSAVCLNPIYICPFLGIEIQFFDLFNFNVEV